MKICLCLLTAPSTQLRVHALPSIRDDETFPYSCFLKVAQIISGAFSPIEAVWAMESRHQLSI